MTKYITRSTKETQQKAADIASKFSGGVIALIGELGSGKTTFTQGFAKGLNIKDKIISPTFVLIRQHQIPGKNAQLFHLDLYRLEDSQDLQILGIQDMLENPNNIILIEWAEKALNLLPKNIVTIKFRTIDEKTREITVS